MKDIKRQFAERLKQNLKAYYKGKIPSNSKIACDFTLRASNLPPISHETIRQWLRGESLPHVSRLNVLTAWLGEDLINVKTQPMTCLCNKREARECLMDNQQLCDALAKLMPEERQTLTLLVGLLSNRR